MTDNEIAYSLIPRERLEEVNKFLVKHFFSNEPLGLSLGAEPEKDVRPWLSKVTKPLIDQKVFIFPKGQCERQNLKSFFVLYKNLKDVLYGNKRRSNSWSDA